MHQTQAGAIDNTGLDSLLDRLQLEWAGQLQLSHPILSGRTNHQGRDERDKVRKRGSNAKQHRPQLLPQKRLPKSSGVFLEGSWNADQNQRQAGLLSGSLPEKLGLGIFCSIKLQANIKVLFVISWSLPEDRGGSIWVQLMVPLLPVGRVFQGRPVLRERQGDPRIRQGFYSKWEERRVQGDAALHRSKVLRQEGSD